ncbi:ergothioneine biosynthesis protein EgtB [Maricurvus nonylphenolicus]|uniref:ergothioneine biosynthesis protein EgtB n=1 Tax=Maricurvus nonylphenolicus TaxID=1008307 RepID=UPI0036F30834
MIESKAADKSTCFKDRYIERRQQSLRLTQGLDAEDMVVQSMPDASPTKWHLAHTTWFFEQFVLLPYAPNYRVFHPTFNYLFNSYYNNVGERHARPLRGLLTRPTLSQVQEYRQTIDEAVCNLLDKLNEFDPDQAKVITGTLEVGLHHEMQHQELMLTDILHALSFNKLYPPMRPVIETATSQAIPLSFESFDEGLYTIGATGKGFSFDCEYPRHQSYLPAFAIANRPITNGEWLEFIKDGGYHTSTLWLSDGWDQCQQQQWQAPLYWEQEDGGKEGGQWLQFSHYGRHAIVLNAPVCHISYYEADAYATWADARLPTEQEWEMVATRHPIKGNFQEKEQWLPQAAQLSGMQQLYGDVWEWTRSAYSPYPGYRAPAGAIGEYNGKFMSNQFVLRGGSCVTPIEQLRPSYRNFFYPHQRWQFTGLRLAKDI